MKWNPQDFNVLMILGNTISQGIGKPAEKALMGYARLGGMLS